MCQLAGSRESLWGMTAQTHKASESVKKFGNSIIGLPVMEDCFILSLFLARATHLTGIGYYG